MYLVKVDNKGGYSFGVKSKDAEFIVSLDGKNITPPDTLLASIGTCIGVYLRKYAEGAKFDLSEFSISVSADFSKEPPVCFRKINVDVDLKVARPDERRLKAISEFVKNCPVHNTLKANPDIEIRIS